MFKIDFISISTNQPVNHFFDIHTTNKLLHLHIAGISFQLLCIHPAMGLNGCFIGDSITMGSAERSRFNTDKPCSSCPSMPLPGGVDVNMAWGSSKAIGKTVKKPSPEGVRKVLHKCIMNMSKYQLIISVLMLSARQASADDRSKL